MPTIRTVVLACLAACSSALPTTENATSSRTVAVVGQAVDITLQNVGPGAFATPPDVSSAAVRYVTVVAAPPYVPAGETQRFSFVAVQSGRAIVTFRQSGSPLDNRTVVDTIDVK